MKVTLKLPLARKENLVVKELPNEMLIYDLANNKAFCLNETARAILDQCDGKTSVTEAAARVGKKFKTKISEDLVWVTVDQLNKAGMFKVEYKMPVETNRITRRKALQAAATLGISIPIVTSLIAPTAAHAQTGCIPIEGGRCDLQVNNCCPPGVCIDIGDGFTACVVCIPLGQPCNLEGSPCCGQAFCFETEAGPTGFQCVPPI